MGMLSEEQRRQQMRDKVNELLGHDGKDGTYIYCLTRVKEAFGYGTMTFDDFQEVDEDFTEQIVDLYYLTYGAECKEATRWYELYLAGISHRIALEEQIKQLRNRKWWQFWKT